MAFDINEVVAQMLSAIKATAAENWKIIKDSANGYFQDHKSRLALLGSLKIQQQISEEFFLSRVADEEKILESELHSIAIVTKAAAQKAANAAIEVFQNAVSKAIGL